MPRWVGRLKCRGCVRRSGQTVHNLSIAGTHTYYIASADGNLDTLVHNASAGCGASRWIPWKRNRDTSYTAVHSSQAKAEAAARADAAVGGRCRVRGVCASNNHVHVDFINRRGQIFHTRHYPFRKGL